MKITNITYQRNGVSGAPFYSLAFTTNEEPGKAFIATFEMDAFDEIEIRSCRVVELTNLTTCWRGDYFAGRIQAELNSMKKKENQPSVYDLIENKRITKSGPQKTK